MKAQRPAKYPANMTKPTSPRPTHLRFHSRKDPDLALWPNQPVGLETLLRIPRQVSGMAQYQIRCRFGIKTEVGVSKWQVMHVFKLTCLQLHRRHRRNT